MLNTSHNLFKDKADPVSGDKRLKSWLQIAKSALIHGVMAKSSQGYYRLFGILAMTGAVFVLASCETGNFIKADNPQVAANPDKVSAMLAESADRASRSLQKLAAIEQTRTPDASIEPVANAPRELQRAITINWVGPAKKITKQMAHRASYKFRVLGVRPSAPIVVSLDKENARLIDILRDIGLQMGQRADVRVDAQSRTVELQYAAISRHNTQARLEQDNQQQLMPAPQRLKQQTQRQQSKSKTDDASLSGSR